MAKQIEKIAVKQADGTMVDLELNANTLGGVPLNTDKKKPFDTVPHIDSEGVVEVGKAIDFHSTNTSDKDYSTRLVVTGDNGNQLYLPSAGGTLALTTDIPSVVDNLNSSSTTESLSAKQGNVLAGMINGKLGNSEAAADSLMFGGQLPKYYAKATDIPSITNLVTGPATATNNALARFDAATGKIIKNSAITLDDNNNLDFNKVGGIKNLAYGNGIYWNPYVESDTDNSDAASITVVKGGNGNGTALEIKQMNDADDIVNIITASQSGLMVNKHKV